MPRPRHRGDPRSCCWPRSNVAIQRALGFVPRRTVGKQKGEGGKGMHQGKSRILGLLAVMAIVASACGSTAATPTAGTGTPQPSASASASAAVEQYPRAETLYTTGKQWGAPSTWNPLDPNAAMGVVGLQYETLFLYDPFKDTYTPWLASAGAWDAAKTTYTITTRDGVKWADGSAFTADDVAFTINLGLTIKALGSSLPQAGLQSATAKDAKTVEVKFSANPAYQEWQQWLYNSPIVPKAIWSAKANENILKETNVDGVGTGPYKQKTHAEDRMVWVKNDGWWATAALKLEVKPKYIVDIVNGANSVALGQLLQGGLDLSNNFLPGVASLVAGGYGITTYYPTAPYMLAGNTATLIPNVNKKPLDDPAFRKALATAINTDDIVNKVYGGIVTKADATGLLPIFSKYVDTAQRDALGFSFSTAKAKSMLAAAGYKDVNGDGLVENKDGSRDQARARSSGRLVRLDGRRELDRCQREARRDQHRSPAPGLRDRRLSTATGPTTARPRRST